MTWPWQYRQAGTSDSSAGSAGLCEKCKDYGMVAFPDPAGWRMLCWNHYCEEMKKQS
jgi:hypothetical protein